MPVEQLRQHAKAGDLLAVEFDGGTGFPAFQLKDAVTVLTIREALAVLSISDQWFRLE
jgi:hypothetical protein